MNGPIFQSFPKFEPNLAEIRKFGKKSGDFAQSLAQKWANWYMNKALFLKKFGICMGLLSNFTAAPPYQNQT